MNTSTNAMRTSRRCFLTTSVSAAAAGLVSVPDSSRGQDAADEKPSNAAPKCLDYGRSFICNTSPKNSVRFWVESRTTVIDDASGTATEFYQCGSCKSEHTFAEKDLFQADNYDFLPIFGGKEVEDLLVFRRPVRISEKYRTVVKSENYWGKPVLKLRPGKIVRELKTWEEIAAATAEAIPLVSQTEIFNPETKLRAIIECPIKTMNIHPADRKYQVDTGPVAFPDLSQKADPLIAIFRLAFIAFNAPHFADFVVEQPTPVTEGEPVEVYHYSNPFSIPAKNKLLAVE